MSGKFPLLIVALLVAGLVVFAAVSSFSSSEEEKGPTPPGSPNRPGEGPVDQLPPPPDLGPDGPVVEEGDGPVGEIAGRVVDSAGKPVPDVQVRLSTHAVKLDPERIRELSQGSTEERMEILEIMRARESRLLRTTRTDASGRFGFTTRAAGPFDVAADHPGYAVATADAVKKGTKNLVLTLARGGGLRGAVVDRDGSPVAGAVLTAAGRTAVSNAAGNFELTGLPTRRILVQAAAKGYAPGSASGTPASGATTELGEPIVLEPVPGLFGRVLDPAGKPLEGVTVAPGVGFVQGFQGDKTDQAGRYHLTQVGGRSVTLLFKHDEYLPKQLENVAFEKGRRLEVPDVKLEPGGEVVGTVTGPDGAPVADAEIGVLPSDRSADLSRMTTMIMGGTGIGTDAEGNYRAAGLETGTYRLVVTAKGFVAEARKDIQVRVPEKTRVDVVLSRGLSLAGVALDSDGAPVKGATVAPTSSRTIVTMDDIMMPDAGAETARTDEDGRFLVRGFTEGYSVTLKVSAGGFVDRMVTEVQPGTMDLKVRLFRAGSISGVVLDAETGEPVGNASVRLATARSARPSVPEPVAVEYAIAVAGGKAAAIGGGNEDGAFLLANVAPGSHRVTATADGYAPATSDEVEVAEGEETSGVEIRLGRGESLRGVVVAAAGGVGIPGATVRLAGPRSLRVSTDQSGVFEARGLVPGHYDVTVTAKQFAKSKLEAIKVPSAGEVRIEMGIGGTVRGIVRDEKGEPVASRPVMLTQGGGFGGFGQNTTASGENGTFKFERVAPGEYTVLAMKYTADSGFGFSSDTRKVVVKEGAEVFVEFGGRGPVTRAHLTGRLLDRGKPMGERMMMLMRADTGGGLAQLMSSFKMITTDGEGRFDIKDLEPGRYRVFAGMMGGQESGVGLDFEITEGGEISEDISLPEGSLRGTVKLARTGKGVAKAKVMLVDGAAIRRPITTIGDMMRVVLAQTVTDSDGSFEIPNADPGTHTIQILAADQAPVTLDGIVVKKAGGSAKRFTIPDGHRISLRATGPDEAPVPGTAIIVFDSEGRRLIIPDQMAYSLGGDGAVEVRLATGTYRIVAQSPSLAQAEKVVQVSRETEVTFEMTGGGRLHVTATSSGGPSEGAVVRLYRLDGTEIAHHLTQESMMAGTPGRETDAEGKLVMDHVPPGTLRVVVTGADGKKGERQVRISEGGENALAVELR